jgi:hypothetical protein
VQHAAAGGINSAWVCSLAGAFEMPVQRGGRRLGKVGVSCYGKQDGHDMSTRSLVKTAALTLEDFPGEDEPRSRADEGGFPCRVPAAQLPAKVWIPGGI